MLLLCWPVLFAITFSAGFRHNVVAACPAAAVHCKACGRVLNIPDQGDMI